ncbi:MAG: hypothetical protein WA005_17555, partial [Candidatus Binataceae bacterium]
MLPSIFALILFAVTQPLTGTFAIAQISGYGGDASSGMPPGYIGPPPGKVPAPAPNAEAGALQGPAGGVSYTPAAPAVS